ncbi:methylcytosine dioxygenase TET isoform X1 [Euwallacea fornicatus]|uniref:methylcytosine dioxygenase TET isoform X1 n=1 Tax=Euwallacea fornicatus TaxID=995702 RepID=UPI00338EB4DD
MSETLSQDPDGLGVTYTTLAPSYPSTPATPSSTVQDVPPGANLPPFSSFASEIDSSGTFSSVSDRLFSDTRLLDISNWDYYTETRLVERGENGLSIISSQPQYRPWESKPVDSTSAFAGTTQVFTDTFSPQNGAASKLPSFQSQFQAFSEATNEPTLTTLTNLTPVSPNSAPSPQGQTLTTLNSSFHTLSAVNPRGYPLVPAPIQAREIPSIQQQFLDERHIQLYSHPTANITINNTIHSASLFPAQNGAIIQNNQLISSPTVVTVLKSDPDIKLGGHLAALHQGDPSMKLQNVALHPTQFQNPITALSDCGPYNGIEKKLNGSSILTSPSRNDFRKKERRKIRANSLESSAESDGASSNMDLGSESSGQVAAVSSTDGFKTQPGLAVGMEHDISGGSMDKQVKKKRKRCGECIGCQKKDNCGDCAPCRNDKSHQICKQRRCEKLTEKKNLYGEPYMRGESRRGRGKGRGGSSYRGRKPNGPISSLASGGLSTGDANGGAVGPVQQPASRPSPQPISQPVTVQQQPMTPMPFYADPNRFPTPVWQAEPPQVSGWQGQFIQQIPSAGQPIDTYQQYPNGIYQTSYQQPAFEPSTFYTSAVQVLTPTNARPPSVPIQSTQMVPPRPNSNYSHTPSPSSANQVQPSQNQQAQPPQQQQSSNRQFQEYNQFGSSSSNNEGSQSRPSSVSSVANQNPPTPNQNYQQNSQQQSQQQQMSQQQQTTVYATVSTANFSPGSSHQQTQFVNANSGNAQPGYPQVNTSSPQVVSHNSSGYPGSEQYSGQQNQWIDSKQDQMMWEQHLQVQETKSDHYQPDQQQNSHSHYMAHRSEGTTPTKLASEGPQKVFSQADKVNLNTRIKTMILNKQQNDVKIDQEVKNVDQNQPTGHFLWYSHHHRLDALRVDGGPDKFNSNYSSDNTHTFAQVKPTTTRKLPPSVLRRESAAFAQISPERTNNNLSMPENSNSNNVCNETDYYLKSHNLHSMRIKGSVDDRIMERWDSTVQHLPRNTYDHNRSEKYVNPEPKFPNMAHERSPVISRARPDASPQYSEPQVQSPYSQQKLFLGGWDIKQEQGAFSSPEDTKSWLQDRRDESSTPRKKLLSEDSFLRKPKSGEKSSPPRMVGEEIPQCHCFSPDQRPPEPGTYYTHLGCASSLRNLRHNLESQTGAKGPAIRIEKIRYTGKEGKTAQGCPIVKWVHRRVCAEEKYLVIVKQRRGHTCHSTFIVVCLVVWEGVTNENADELYQLLTEKLTKFGLPTKRRCSTNDLRTCACQGINEDKCGASYSFGCSWSMYYNGCKFTRSKDVRKFRLNTKEEEGLIEEKLQDLADIVSPMYKALAPQSFKNQTRFEHVAPDCRLGRNPGRPFSGVTACVDFCAHSHKDIHNMVNGCTVVVTLTKHKGMAKPLEEQLHVLPLYVPEDTDEFDSQQNQVSKCAKGEIEVLSKYECEVRTFSEPAEKCKNRKNKREDGQRKRKSSTPHPPSSPSVSSTSLLQSPQETSSFHSSAEIQNDHISSTVMDSPVSRTGWGYDQFSNSYGRHAQSLPSSNSYFNPAAYYSVPQYFSQHYSRDGYLNNNYSNYSNNYEPKVLPPFNHGLSSPDWYNHNVASSESTDNSPKCKTVDIRYSDNTECFRDSEMGGIAIALSHGSVLFECAKHELHATTPLRTPDRTSPTRISLVFYQHRSLNKPQHGLGDYLKLKGLEPVDSKFKTAGLLSNSGGEVGVETSTLPTFSFTTTFPMYPCMVTGAYQEPYVGSKTIPKN